MYDTTKILKRIIIIVVIILILGYTYFQTKDLIRGPVLIITYPSSGMTMKDSSVEIKGSVKNASYVTMNDRQIFVNEEGKFNEKILLIEGYNVIEIDVKDRFERVESKKLELMYIGE